MNQLPITINNLHFSAQKQSLSGVLEATTFERLQYMLAQNDTGSDAPNKVHYWLTGTTDAQNRAFLKLTLDAHLLMHCQRCLAAMPVSIHLDFTYLVSTQTEAEMLESEAAEDDIDLIGADVNMDVGLLIEDELLLALPIAPIHQEPCAVLAMTSGEKMNPFAALKQLKKD